MTDIAPPLIGITIDCADPEPVAAFWEEVLGYQRRADQPHEVGGQYVTLFKPSGVPGLHHVTFQRVPEEKTVKARAHLDLFVESARPVMAAMLAAGATEVETHELGDMTTRILLDPAGNEFCLIGPD